MATISIRSLATAVLTRGAVLAAAFAAAACSVDKATAPSEIGPSGHALTVRLTATPDILARNGSAMSEIKLQVFDAQGAPKGGQRLTLFASAGALSAGDVVTGSGGEATVTYTAPDANVNADEAIVSAIPVGDNFDNSMSRNVAIALLGPAIPDASFTFTPAAPARYAQVTFDASGSTLAGIPCGSSCTYSWAFGSEDTAAGPIVQYRFQHEGVHAVTLTVSAASGVVASTTRSVTVGVSVSPTAAFTSSPADPTIGDTVHFNASSSSGANGATIVEYRWDFGNGGGTTTTSPTTSTTYADDRTYNVQLTVLDSNGQTATVQRTITIAEP
jgi:PKD repeat protein